MTQIKSGASGCVVYIEKTRVTKVGPTNVLRGEGETYKRLSDLLREGLPKLYPRVLEIILQGKEATLTVEKAGEVSLEEWILSLGRSKSSKAILAINEYIHDVITTIWEIVELTRFEDPENSSIFFIEVAEHLANSLRAAEIQTPLSLKKLKKAQQHFVQPMVLSACHRDLGSNNVVLAPDGELKFIDPKYRLKRAYTTPPLPGLGCVVRDFAMFYVNLQRRELELERNHDFGGLEVEAAKEALFSLPDREICSHAFLVLNLAAVYASFSACRCDFCLAPKRVWLLKEMDRETKRLTREVARCVNLDG